MEIFDISQTLCPEMAVWPGDPEFRQERVLDMRKGASTNVAGLRMGTHTGTHIDAPLHVQEPGTDAAQMDLRPFLGPARVVQIQAKEIIRCSDLEGLNWQGIERVLFKTGYYCLAGGGFNPDFVGLHEDAAAFLAKKELLLVGTDAPSIDPADSAALPSHKLLTCAGIAILEGVQLETVPPGDYTLVCLPLKIAGADGSPVRAILWR